MSFTINNDGKEGEDPNNKAKEKEMIQDSSILPITFEEGIFDQNQREGNAGTDNEDSDNENVSTLSFNVIHYVLCKFKMNDIL